MKRKRCCWVERKVKREFEAVEKNGGKRAKANRLLGG